jgi:glutamate racemase
MRGTHPLRQRPIGVFDSGVGGLTVVRQLRRLLPAEDLIYLGDTARVPYGTKSPATVERFACEDALFLARQQVKAIVVACNTASALALATLEEKFALPVFGVIAPGAHLAAKQSRLGRIGVIGTSSTIRSGAYARAIHRERAAARVFATACPLLVPLVEEGWLHEPVTLDVLRRYLAPLQRARIDTLVLGCTHYPLLKPAIRKVTGEDVRLIDSAQSCAAHVRDRLGALELLAKGRRRAGVIQPYVTDEPDRFRAAARRFLRVPAREPLHVELPALPSGFGPAQWK